MCQPNSFSLLPFFPCSCQKRNGLQMNQKMPTHGTFRSSPWALTWPTKSTNTSPLVVWFHRSEKSKMNAEHGVFLLTHQTSVHSFKGNLGEITLGGGMTMMTAMLKTNTLPFTHSSNLGLDWYPNRKGPPMCIPLMLLPCSWTFNLLLYP